MRTFKLVFTVITLLMAACVAPQDPTGPIGGGGVPPDNHAPSVTAASIEDRPYFRGDVITVTPEGWNDVDNDPPSYRYQWFVNGVVAPGENLASLHTEQYAKGDTIACGVLPFDGFVTGPPVVSNIVELFNSAPVLATVSLGGPHTKTSVIRATPLDATDADDDVLSYTYTWILNGVPLAAAAPTLSGIFVKGDTVQAIVTVSDGEKSSGPVSSPVIQIQNILPVLTSVSISAGPFTSTDTITVSAAGSDGDGDPVTFKYQWYVNGYAANGATVTTFAGGFSGNDQVYVTAWPFDGEQWGASLYSNVVLIQNSPPVVLTAAIPAGTYQKGVAIPSSVTTSDPDAGAVVSVGYSWYVNNVFAGSGNTLSGATLKRGDSVYFIAVPYDQTTYGAAVSSNVITILNTAPTAATIAISPDAANADADDILRANLTTLSTDADGDAVTYRYAWYQNDVLQGFPDALTTISASLTTTGDTWKVVVTPMDMFGDGISASDSVTLYGSSATIAVAVYSGANVSCVIVENGSVSCWGDKYYGQIGDGTSGQISGTSAVDPRAQMFPSPVTALSEPMSSLSIGSRNVCGVTRLGGLLCWGVVYSGATSSVSLMPVAEMSFTSGIKQVATSGLHTCVLTTAGGVKCWGRNDYGQVGDGAGPQTRGTPGNVVGLQSGVNSIATGRYNSCAVLNDGTVKCWGRNDYGQTGIGNNASQSVTTPVTVADLGGLASEVKIGTNHACALLLDQAVRCWGDNPLGQVGDGSSLTIRLTPVTASGISGAVALSLSDQESCARLENTSVICWGVNYAASVTGVGFLQAVPYVALESGATGFEIGARHGCGVLANGTVTCWGWNKYGQTADGLPMSSRPQPAKVLGAPAPVTLPAFTSASLSCAAAYGGVLNCWGLAGQLGAYFTATAMPFPVFPSGITVIAIGNMHSCVGLVNHQTWCWGGSSNFGQLGNGNTNSYATPVLSQLGYASHLVVGYAHSCGARGTMVKCWGWNATGQLGVGALGNQVNPTDTGVRIANSNAPKQALAAGQNHTCAISVGGNLLCWGKNIDGQIGNGNTSQQNTPVQVLGLTSGVLAVAAGEAHTCAIVSTGVKCWGSNSAGQLGDGTLTSQNIPVDVPGTAGAIWIAAGYAHSCAVLSSGSVVCWGANNFGQLGLGFVSDRNLTPIASLVLPESAQAVSIGFSTTCVTTSASYYCFGYGERGTIGDGYLSWMPHLIKGFGGVFPW